MPRELTPEGKRKPRNWYMKEELDDKVLKTIENIAKATYNALGPAVSQAREKFGQAGMGSPVAQALPGVSRAIAEGGALPKPAQAAPEEQPQQYGPRPPAYEVPPAESAGIEGTTEMAEAFRGAPGPVRLPSGGEVTMTAAGAGNLIKYPWATAAIMDPEGFIRENPQVAKAFTDKRTGKLDIEAIKNFEQSRIKEEAEGLQPDYSLAGRKSFEEQVFKRIGGNPFTFHASQSVKDSSRFLPDLFNEVFQGKVAWEDRDKLNEQEEALWQTEQRRFRAAIKNRAIAKNQERKQKYDAIMNQWDAAAGRAALSKEAVVALEKAEALEPLEIRRAERKEKAAATAPKTFQDARNALNQQLKTSIFQGRMVVPEEERKYYGAVLKRFDFLRGKTEAGEKGYDYSPADLPQKALDDVNRILEIYWKDYNAIKNMSTKEVKEKFHSTREELLEIGNEKAKQRLGYVPVTPRE